MAVPFIYVMKGLRKVVPPSKIILDDIWLSFYPDAKIGVLGPNGAGKSSVLRIMAGVDQDFQGEAWPAKGTRIGFLAQEPQLDASRCVECCSRSPICCCSTSRRTISTPKASPGSNATSPSFPGASWR